MAKKERSNLTQRLIESLKPTDKQVDYADGLVRGLALRVSPGGSMTWVLIKRLPDVGPRRICLGRYVRGAEQPTVTFQPEDGFPSGNQVLSLKHAREEATRVLALIHAGRSPAKEKILAATKRVKEASRGTFRDLLQDYVAWRKEGTEKRAPASARQVSEWTRLIDRLDKLSPGMLDLKAGEIEPAHIVALLRPVFHSGIARPTKGRGSKGRRSVGGAQGGADKLQTFLRAAFAYGLSSEHSVARRTARTYGLVHNPVAPIPREAKSIPVTRVLSADELRQFWNTIGLAPNVGAVMAHLLRFTIASGGQRTHQLAREPWTSYDLEQKVISLIDKKGRGGQPRVHLVPMSTRMVKILKELERLTGNHAFPWSTSERGHIDIASPAGAVRYWLQSEHAVLDGKRIPPFTPRDLRRTATQLMKAAGVPDTFADRLQSHGLTDVVSRHYRADPTLYVREKLAALKALDKALEVTLVPKAG